MILNSFFFFKKRFGVQPNLDIKSFLFNIYPMQINPTCWTHITQMHIWEMGPLWSSMLSILLSTWKMFSCWGFTWIPSTSQSGRKTSLQGPRFCCIPSSKLNLGVTGGVFLTPKHLGTLSWHFPGVEKPESGRFSPQKKTNKPRN